MPGANRSTMPPRTAYSPVSCTVPERRKPLPSSQATRSSVATELPGAAEKLSAATAALGGTRWVMALIVVERMRGRSDEDFDRANRDSTVMRRASMAAWGETRS